MSKTPEEKRSKLLRKIAKMPAEEFRRKLQNKNFVKKLKAIGIISTR